LKKISPNDFNELKELVKKDIKTGVKKLFKNINKDIITKIVI